MIVKCSWVRSKKTSNREHGLEFIRRANSGNGWFISVSFNLSFCLHFECQVIWKLFIEKHVGFMAGYENAVNVSCRNSFCRLSKPEAMDDEVSQILKKWNLSNPTPRRDVENGNESFDTRTFTRPTKRRTFTNDGLPSIESGVSYLSILKDAQTSFPSRLLP